MINGFLLQVSAEQVCGALVSEVEDKSKHKSDSKKSKRHVL